MAIVVLPDPCCVLLIGAAGAGKSTLAARLFPPDAILSSDALRAAISGDAADQSASPVAFRALHRALARRLAAGRLTVIDATNVEPAARRTILAIARRHRVPAVAIVLDLPADEVRRRNRHRVGRRVPTDVVDRHLEALAATVATDGLADEGYAGIVRLRTPAAVDELEIELRIERRPAPPA